MSRSNTRIERVITFDDRVNLLDELVIADREDDLLVAAGTMDSSQFGSGFVDIYSIGAGGRPVALAIDGMVHLLQFECSPRSVALRRSTHSFGTHDRTVLRVQPDSLD